MVNKFFVCVLRAYECDDDELAELKYAQMIEISLGPTKKWRMKQIDKLDKFYCS